MYGKILGAMIGAGLGLALHSVLAALALAALGTIVGHFIDEAHAAPELSDHPGQPSVQGTAPPPPEASEPAAPERPALESRGVFARHLCTLCIEVARADGQVVQGEIRVVREFFENDLQFGPAEMERVRLLLKQAVAQPRDLEAATRACHGELLSSERLLLLNTLYELALADGSIKRSESDAIKRVVAGLGISDEDHRSITAMHFGEGAAHYAVLGLEPDASDEEIKGAFRRLAAAHHPDRVAHLGAGAAELAGKRFREIKDAYDELRRIRVL
ncbi:MAG: J domain-containing protein [Myxococcaceae bacterium]